MLENYYKITSKVLSIFQYGVQNVSAKFIMKCDDDSFVNIKKILPKLHTIADKPAVVMGTPLRGKPIRDETHKWYLSKEEYPDEFFPRYLEGPGLYTALSCAQN